MTANPRYTVYGVFDHVNAPGQSSHTGMVVRTGYHEADGRVFWPAPYRDEVPVRTYLMLVYAQRCADRLNAAAVES